MRFQHIKKFLLVLFLSVAVFSCDNAEVVPDQQEEEPIANNYNVDAQKLVNLVNNYRTEGCTCGSENMPPVPAIRWNDTLAKIGYLHSKDMKENNYFSHTAKNGSSPSERTEAGGYDWRAVGENIAKGYMNEETVVQGWIDSEGHCRNIMNAAFDEMGVGREGEYWTQMFGAR